MAKLLRPLHTESVLATVRHERSRQDGIWGLQGHDPFTWIAILGEEFGEAAQAALKLRFDPGDESKHMRSLIEELAQTAAVAVVAIESLERQTDYPIDRPSLGAPSETLRALLDKFYPKEEAA